MTSIATGIVTVSLMDQAPSGVTRVVNQIVEHTVQTVIPATQGAAAAASSVKTVVVKDDDLTAQSIAAVQKSMVRITTRGSNLLVARGVIIDAKGTALTDSSALTDSGADSFDAILPSGERVQAVLRGGLASTSALAVMDLTVGTSTGFAPAALADVKKLSLGQSVIGIGGKGADTVGSGVIAMLPSVDTPGLISAGRLIGNPRFGPYNDFRRGHRDHHGRFARRGQRLLLARRAPRHAGAHGGHIFTCNFHPVTLYYIEYASIQSLHYKSKRGRPPRA